eukprot:jgi/Botrbrau1/11022/Bobra.101_1s0020.1
MSSCVIASSASTNMSMVKSSRSLASLKPAMRYACAMPRALATTNNTAQGVTDGPLPAPTESKNQSSTAVMNAPSRRSLYVTPYSASPFTGLLPRRINNLFKEMEEEINAMTRDVWGDINRDFLSGPITPTGGASLGATDVKETETAFELHVDAPGLTKEDVKVALDKDGVLTISGERQTVSEESKDNFKRVERVFGTFTRRFQVPEGVEKDKISAKVENGVLRVELPKAAEPNEPHEQCILVE